MMRSWIGVLAGNNYLERRVDAHRRGAFCGLGLTVIAFDRKAVTVLGKRITDL